MAGSDSLAIAPLGRYHPRSACWWCGIGLSHPVSADVNLEMIVVPMTRAYAWRCADRKACERRRANGVQLGLFGEARR